MNKLMRTAALGSVAVLALLLGGCVDGPGPGPAVNVGVGYQGYGLYDGPYYGGYGPYYGDTVVIGGGYRHHGYYGGHHIYGGGYRGGSRGRFTAVRGAGFNRGGARGAGIRGGHAGGVGGGHVGGGRAGGGRR